MPKVVVNLLKIDENISFLESVVKEQAESMDSVGYGLSTHSIENEIQYLKDFKNSFELAITKKQSELLNERLASTNQEEACESIKDANGKLLVTDRFGNTFLAPPYKYSYVELTYSNFKKFDRIRFLGEIGLVILSRFQMEDVEHEISPTTLSLLSNIDKIKEEARDYRNVLDLVDGEFRKLKERCEDVRSGKRKPFENAQRDWRNFFQDYFHAPVQYKLKTDKDFPKFKEAKAFNKKDIEGYLQQIEADKEKILKILEDKKLKSASDPKKENPSKGTKQDTDKEKPEMVECETEKTSPLQGIEDALNDLSKELERQIENWGRRFDPACIIKELIECTLPPNLDFCDFVFKDITIPKFYQKIRILKTFDQVDFYNQIDAKLQEETGLTSLNAIDDEIKSLEALLEEEDRLRDKLNNSIENYKKNALSLTEDLAPLIERRQFAQQKLEEAEMLNNQAAKEKIQKRIQNLSRRIEQIQQRLDLLEQQNRSTPENLKRLNTNYDEHLLRKGVLERDFSQKIAENKFNERQEQLIREGKNLEAIFLIPNEDEKYSQEAIATTIINAVDSVIPLENLCKMLIQLPMVRDVNLPPQVPENLLESFAVRIKDPFSGISVDFGKLLFQLLAVFLLNILDSLLKALCDALGNVVSNDNEGKDLFNSAIEGVLQQSSEVFGPALNSITGNSIALPTTTGSADIASAISQTGANLVNTAIEETQQNLVSWIGDAPPPFLSGQSSPFAEWDLAPDGKSFVIKNPPVFDFTQIQQFIQSGITQMVQAGEEFSTQALMDMMSGEEGETIEEEPPKEERVDISLEEARVEIKCLFSKASALLTPTETMQLLTKKPEQNTIKIVNKLAEICAPNLAISYPGDGLVNLLGELGILAGAVSIEDKLNDIADLNNNLPITEKVLCERYENTFTFRQALMSNAIDPKLAGEILEEIENKKQEELQYIIDSITDIAEGKILEKPQTAKQFYSSVISQIIDMQKQGQEPNSLEQLDTNQSNGGEIDIKEVLQEKIEQETQNNSALNSMMELTAESLLRPCRDRFRRDSENYIDAISLDVPHEKEIKRVQTVQTPEGPKEIPNMDLINVLNMDYVPVVKIPNGTVTISPPKNENELGKAQKKKEEKKEVYEYRFSSLMEGSLSDEERDKIEVEIEYIRKEIESDFKPWHANRIKNKGKNRTADQRYYETLNYFKDKVSTIDNNYWFSPMEELLEALADIKLYTPTNIYSTNDVSGSLYEFKLVPSYILPFKKQVGDKTVLMNRPPNYDLLHDPSKSLVINVDSLPPWFQDDFYISNGFIEDLASKSFVDPEINDSKYSTILENKKEVGKKYRDALEIFSDSLSLDIDEQNYRMSISSKHMGSNASPLLSRIDSNTPLDYDSVVSNMLTEESINCLIQSTREFLGNTQESLDNLQIANGSLQDKLANALPLWKIEYEQPENQDPKFSVKTSGLSFSPTGKYDDFYHDTELSGNDNVMSEQIREMLMSRYGSVPSKLTAFQYLLEPLSVFVDRHRSLPSPGLPNITENVSFQEMYRQINFTLISNISKIFVGDSRLLDNVEESDKKLIEMFDFVRTQTEYEKENELDPNIMDFVQLKKQFSSLYNGEKEEELTTEQLRGEKSSDNKATKSAKNVLLNSFARLCINEYILKNIFIFEPISFTKQIIDFTFILNDIANFIVQEAKRMGIGEEIQQQSVKYYDSFIKEKDEQKDDIEEKMSAWKSKNSFSSVIANPKMVKIAREQVDFCLNKFSTLLNCEENNPNTDYFIDKILATFQQDATFRKNEINRIFVNAATGGSLSELYLLTGTIIYVEKYVRMPNFTSKAEQRISQQVRDEIEEFLGEEISISQFEQIIKILGIPLRELYVCDSEGSIFDSPVAFGAKILVETVGQQKNTLYTVTAQEEAIELEILETQDTSQVYETIYRKTLYPGLTTDRNSQIFFKYCLGFSEISQMVMTHNFLYHNDQEARFLFEGSKMMMARMYMANMRSGNHSDAVNAINNMLEEQKRNEENTGNPLGPALEALKFYYRTPIQILKGVATTVDPNIALSDVIVKGAAMAGNLSGQQINIPYSVASLSLLPFPLFNGVAPPIPPLSSYNVALPIGPIFLGLEPLLNDLPYYSNKEQGKLPTGNGKQNPYNNPLFCELSNEENDEE